MQGVAVAKVNLVTGVVYKLGMVALPMRVVRGVPRMSPAAGLLGPEDLLTSGFTPVGWVPRGLLDGAVPVRRRLAFLGSLLLGLLD